MITILLNQLYSKTIKWFRHICFVAPLEPQNLSDYYCQVYPNTYIYICSYIIYYRPPTQVIYIYIPMKWSRFVDHFFRGNVSCPKIQAEDDRASLNLWRLYQLLWCWKIMGFPILLIRTHKRRPWTKLKYSNICFYLLLKEAQFNLFCCLGCAKRNSL